MYRQRSFYHKAIATFRVSGSNSIVISLLLTFLGSGVNLIVYQLGVRWSDQVEAKLKEGAKYMNIYTIYALSFACFWLVRLSYAIFE